MKAKRSESERDDFEKLAVAEIAALEALLKEANARADTWEKNYTNCAEGELLKACKLALEALRGAVTEHGRMCAIKEGGACDCWLPLRRRAIDELEDAIDAASNSVA